MDDAPDEPDDYLFSPVPLPPPPPPLPDDNDNDDNASDYTSDNDDESEKQIPSPHSPSQPPAEPSPEILAQSTNKSANSYFRANAPAQAEALYTKAILLDPTAATLYTNRAMARLQLGMWDAVLADCGESLRVKEVNMKARYYGAQALLRLGRAKEALGEAKKAYEVATLEGAGSLGSVVGVVLRCKKAVWEEKERLRMKGREGVRGKVVEGLRRDLERVLMEVEEGEDTETVRREWEEVIEEVEAVWIEAGKAEKKREVPEWMIDEITFAVMVDPVVTKTGKSYERASILEHLRRSPTDPLTREPLRPDELRPNLALREACEAFVKENGWAVDY